MRLWRLSSARRARDFTGGYGLFNNGRWNTAGRPVTYCATVPSLAALEKRVHVTDAADLPPQAMVTYDVPDDISVRTVDIGDLPTDWARRETHTQQLGDAWLDGGEEAMLLVPSVIVPIADAADRNVLINHRRPEAARITIAEVVGFTLDPRLFRIML
ncbi:MAG TPA: RES family NAD+ phosphorylase [Xanthobacteraceae bacterium]|nr:RES family NAD+ phosphorylase [Xanthobacteraceae bacterium]